MKIFNLLFITSLMILLTTSCAHRPRNGRYVKVKEGDSYTSLAKEFGIKEALLKEANEQLDLLPGGWVFIPEGQGIFDKLIGGFISGQSDSDYPYLSSFKLIWPVPASKRISSHYGLRWGRNHHGIDIPAHRGSAILAAADGVVIYSGRALKAYGNLTVISHLNGLYTVYAHAQKNFVKRGEKVYRGQVIAKVGNTGRSTGPHLHFEVRHFDRSIDPLPYLHGQGRFYLAENEGSGPTK